MRKFCVLSIALPFVLLIPGCRDSADTAPSERSLNSPNTRTSDSAADDRDTRSGRVDDSAGIAPASGSMLHGSGAPGQAEMREGSGAAPGSAAGPMPTDAERATGQIGSGGNAAGSNAAGSNAAGSNAAGSNAAGSNAADSNTAGGSAGAHGGAGAAGMGADGNSGAVNPGAGASGSQPSGGAGAAGKTGTAPTTRDESVKK